MNEFMDPRVEILGNSSIGIFAFSQNSYTIVPTNAKQIVVDTVRSILKTKVIMASVANTFLNGLFVTGNQHHLLIPGLVSNQEYHHLKTELEGLDVSIHVMESKITAFGNAIVCSDKTALIHPEFTAMERKEIGNSLDVEVINATVMNNPLVGSMVFRSNKGLLAHPEIPDEELDWLSDLFKVKADVVTVNRGTPYPRPGILANENGFLVGSDTTGPEILRISEVLT